MASIELLKNKYSMSKLSEDIIIQTEQCLLRCWSINTSSKWTLENPYKGQCGVTSLVINDLFGGKILKTKVEGQWHFYNQLEGKRYDFTDQQFDFKIDYQDVESNREEAFADTNEFQYSTLKELIAEKFNQHL